MAVTITRTPWIDDDGTGTTGTVINNAVKTSLYNEIDGALAKLNAPSGPVFEQGRATAMGFWIDVPFNPANFTGKGAMTWSVGAGPTFNRYTLIGQTLIWLLFVEAASLGGTADTQLYVKLPGGFTGASKRGVTPTTQIYDGTTSVRGWVRVNTDGQSVIIEKDPSAAFALNTGLTYIEFSLILEIA
jgi:hypothetical protein